MSSDFTPVKGGETFEQIRHNLSMSGIDEDVAGIMLKPNYERDDNPEAKKKKGRAANDAIFDATLRLSQQLNQAQFDLREMEQSMEALYGEDFDLNFAATLLEDDYKRIASIKDIEERRAEVARMINEGLENGTIKPEDLEQFGGAMDWTKQHEKVEELEQQMEMQMQLKHEKELHASPDNPSVEQGLDNALSAPMPSFS